MTLLPRPAGRALAPLTALALVAAGVVLPGTAAAAATTLTVTDPSDAPVDAACDDGEPGTTLREALCLAAAEPVATVVVPGGTVVTLTAGPLVVDPGVPARLWVGGAGGTVTIDGAGGRILDLGPSLTGGLDVTLERVELRGGVGAATADEPQGGGAIIAGSGDPDRPDTLRLVDCVLRDNAAAPSPGDASAPGGAVQMWGGTLEITRCEVTGNTADGAPGGAVAMLRSDGAGAPGDVLTITDSTFTGNTVTNSGVPAGVLGGGAVYTQVPSSLTGSTLTANAVTAAPGASGPQGSAVLASGPLAVVASDVSGNSLTGGTDLSGPGGALAVASGSVEASRLVGNTETIGGTTRHVAVNGPVTVSGSWFGCADGPTAGCQAVTGGATAVDPAVLTLDAAPEVPLQGERVTVTAAVLLSSGGPADPRLRALLAGRAVTWTAAPAGSAGSPTAVPTLGPDLTATYAYDAGAAEQVTVGADVDGAARDVTVRRAVQPEVGRPADVTVAEGSEATFTAAVAGYPEPSLRWQTAPPGSEDWTDVPGATSATLTFPAERVRTGARFRVVAANLAGESVGAAGTLTVTWGPEVTAGPQDAVVVAGDEARFEVTADGVPVPSVQWQVLVPGGEWGDLAGATGAALVRITTADDDGLRVRAVVTGASGDVVTDDALLTVQSPLVVTASPADAVTLEGHVVAFEVAVDGSPTATSLVWELRAPGESDWQEVPAGEPRTVGTTTTSTLHLAPPRTLDGAQVRARAATTLVTGTHEVVTDPATLTVHWGPGTSDPQDLVVVAGDEARFEVVAAGSPAPSVQWQVLDAGEWADVPGATGPVWVRTVSAADDGARVRAVVTGADGAITSGAATLTVQTPLVVTGSPQSVTAVEGDEVTFSAGFEGSPGPSAVVWEQRGSGEDAWTEVAGGEVVTSGTTSTATLVLTAERGLAGAELRARATTTLVTGAHEVVTDPATLTVQTPLVVTGSPQSVTAVEGDEVTFSAGFEGSPGPSAVVWEQRGSGEDAWTEVAGGEVVTSGTTSTATVTLIAERELDGAELRARATTTLVTGAHEVVTDPATLTVQTPLVVTGSPQSVTAVEGDEVTFSAGFEGSPGPSAVVWEQRGSGEDAWTEVAGGEVVTSGTTSTATLVLTAERGLAGAELRARATTTLVTGAHEVVTDPAELAVRWAPEVTSQPTSLAVPRGQEAELSVQVDAQPAADVVWEQQDEDGEWQPTGATGEVLTVVADGAVGEVRRFRAVATNVVGSTVSAVAEVTTHDAPVFLTSPQDVTADQGSEATFTVQVSGAPEPDVHWETRTGDGAWTPVDGAQSGTLVLTAEDDLEVRAVADNAVGSGVTSAVATLTVLTPPAVTDPADVTVGPGERAEFEVRVQGRPEPTVTWETSADDGLTWSEATEGLVLALTPTAADDGLRVRARATSVLVAGETSVVSATARLTVTEPEEPEEPEQPGTPEQPEPEVPGPVREFRDVPSGHPFYEEIHWMAASGLSRGYTDGTFRPSTRLSRQAMAAFVQRYAGDDDWQPAPGTQTFSDVPGTHPFHREIEWLAAHGLAEGYADGTFRPSVRMSRQAMAAFLYRLSGDGSVPPTGAQTFTDVPPSHPFHTEIEWMARRGLAAGFQDGTFGGARGISRQATAAFLFRHDALS